MRIYVIFVAIIAVMGSNVVFCAHHNMYVILIKHFIQTTTAVDVQNSCALVILLYRLWLREVQKIVLPIVPVTNVSEENTK